MGYKVSYEQADKIFEKLSETYEIWAPKRFKGKGRYSQTDLIRYDRVCRAEDIEYRELSLIHISSHLPGRSRIRARGGAACPGRGAVRTSAAVKRIFSGIRIPLEIVLCYDK